MPYSLDADHGIRQSWKFTEEHGRGLIGSLLVHIFAALLVFFFIERMPHLEPTPFTVVPVDVVLGSGGTPFGQHAMAPRPTAPHVSRTVLARASVGVAPQAKNPPPDELESKLQALAELKAPQTDPRLLGPFATPGDPSSGNGGNGNYSVKDYVRAQVERHWNPDVTIFGAHNLAILIHLVMKNDGTITEAEIVGDSGDAAYRSLAISARNAVLLSSPIALPPGRYDKVMDITLDLNPKETLR